MTRLDLEAYLRFLPNLQNAPEQTIWLSYDSEADVLYINFKKPSVANDSELTDDNIVVRYQDDEVVGYTILHARQRG